MSPNPMNNPNICRLLRCTPPELRQLKNAFKTELQAQSAGGKPFLGQLPSESDPDGAIREEQWEAVARKEPMLGALLSGGRYRYHHRDLPPVGFERDVKAAKDKIFLDLNMTVRRAPQRRKRPGLEVQRMNQAAEEVVSLFSEHEEARRSVSPEMSPPWRSETLCGRAVRTSPDERTPMSSERTSTERIDRSSDDAGPRPDIDIVSERDRPEPPAHTRSMSPAPAPNVQIGPPATTLPAAVRRIQELETRVEAHEQQIQQRDLETEERVMRRVHSTLAERDRVIERLRWYLEGDV